MVEMTLFAIAGGIVLILAIISLALFGMGFFIKAAKKILWVIAILFLIIAIYFMFFG